MNPFFCLMSLPLWNQNIFNAKLITESNTQTEFIRTPTKLKGEHV